MGDPFVAAREVLGPSAKLDEKDSSVAAQVEGVAITIRFATRGGGSWTESFTEVDAEVAIPDLVLALRKQTRVEDVYLREGLAVDHLTGDEAFDRAFVVEAAPRDIALALLDADVRRALLALGDVALLKYNRGVRLEQRIFVEDVTRLKAMVALATSVARKVPAAREVARTDGEGYRHADVGLRSRQQAEVVELRQVQANRDDNMRRSARIATIIMVLVIFALVGVAFLIKFLVGT